MICIVLCGCEKKRGAITTEAASDASTASEEDYCASFDIALNGVFKTAYQEGTMTWKGGRKGSVEIAGVDFNEMTCTYNVPICGDAKIDMICNQAAYTTDILLFTPDSIMLGQTIYTRVK